MKIVYNIYVAVRKLWNAIFGKNGDGSQLVIPGRISGASGDVTVGGALDLTDNQLTAKKIYWHNLFLQRGGENRTYLEGYVVVLNNDPTPITTTTFLDLLKTSGFFALVTDGRYGGTTDVTGTNQILMYVTYLSESQFRAGIRADSTHTTSTVDLSIIGFTVTDLGANAIN